MKIKVLQLGYLQTNCYLLILNNKVLLIDPADEFDVIKSSLNNLNLVGVIVTHHHPDHVGALEKVIKEYNVKLYDFYSLNEGKNKIDNFEFEVIHTPGHTSDSITIYFEKQEMMFVGDFIFKNSIGRTDLPTGEYNVMKQSIRKIKGYSDVIIYPGHGDSTTLDYEKKSNEFFFES